LLDVLRGFALFGVVLANFVQLNTDYSQASPVMVSSLDGPALVFVRLFVNSKFYTIFSILFGIGFAVQILRADRAGRAFLPAYTRRILVLLSFGVVNFLFMWYSDILAIYAVLAAGLLCVRSWSNRRLVVVSILLALVPHTAVALYRTDTRPVLTEAQRATARAAATEVNARQHAVFADGTLMQVVRQNVSIYAGGLMQWGFTLWAIPGIFARFLLGYWIGRSNVLEKVAHCLPLLRRLRWWSLGTGITGSVLMALEMRVLEGRPPLWFAAAFTWLIDLGVFGLAFFYVCSIAILFHQARWYGRLLVLAPMGQMALTNYLTQSLIFVLLLYGFAGPGLIGEFGPAACVAVSAAIICLQLIFSRWWLRRFRYGPAEWVWRSLTYVKWQPIRIPPAAAAMPQAS
jgi:uncharacterized protein